MTKEVTALCQAGCKKNIQRLIGAERIRAVSSDNCRGEKFFLFSMEKR